MRSVRAALWVAFSQNRNLSFRRDRAFRQADCPCSCARDTDNAKLMHRRQRQGITNASALVIETAITDNAQPFNQPWPPTGVGDGWHAVDKFSTRQRTFWRRIRLEYARPSSRARPVHR